jgi:hypothetical protein
MPRNNSKDGRVRGKEQGKIYILELAYSINRSPHTIRQWQAAKELPPGTYPQRDERGWRYWTPEQVDRIAAWLESRRPQSESKLAALRMNRLTQEDKRSQNLLADELDRRAARLSEEASLIRRGKQVEKL